MLIRVPRGWEIPEGDATTETIYRRRREFLRTVAAATGAQIIGCDSGILRGGPPTPTPEALSAARNPRFATDGLLTQEEAVFRYNNYYEFTEGKNVHRYVERFTPRPWTVEVAGLVQHPRVWDIDELLKMPLEERTYRFRCVEAWYMDVPWIGFPLRLLLDAARPLAKARYVRLICFQKKKEAPGQEFAGYPWPYREGLTLAEATHELTLATVGLYGRALASQSGAPLRVVVPWKYGFKGPKGVVRIELVADRPRTFWNDLQPQEYGFESNVDPRVPHPRWSQATERSIDGSRSRPTQFLNGYAPWVASLYSR